MSLNAIKAVSTFLLEKIIGDFENYFCKNQRGFFPLPFKLFACTFMLIQIEIETGK